MTVNLGDTCGLCGSVELKAHCGSEHCMCFWAVCVTCGAYGVPGTDKWAAKIEKTKEN